MAVSTWLRSASPLSPPNQDFPITSTHPRIIQAFINESGEIIHNRRKIKPTHVERSLWGEGQADSLKCVVDSQHGRIGALNCWENLQPLLRFYEYSQNVQIHVAAWPSFAAHPREVNFPLPYSNSGEASQRLSQMVAMEGQTFVLCATGVLKAETHELMGVKDRGVFHGVCCHPASGGGPDEESTDRDYRTAVVLR